MEWYIRYKLGQRDFRGYWDEVEDCPRYEIDNQFHFPTDDIEQEENGKITMNTFKKFLRGNKVEVYTRKGNAICTIWNKYDAEFTWNYCNDERVIEIIRDIIFSVNNVPGTKLSESRDWEELKSKKFIEAEKRKKERETGSAIIYDHREFSSFARAPFNHVRDSTSKLFIRKPIIELDNEKRIIEGQDLKVEDLLHALNFSFSNKISTQIPKNALTGTIPNYISTIVLGDHGTARWTI